MEKVEIRKDRLKELEKNEMLLACLKDKGVESWDGWEHALARFEAMQIK